MFTNPAVSDFQNLFFRDFPYGTDITTSVVDQDILNAFALVIVNFNPGLAPDQNTYTQMFLYLAAHYLVLNIRNSSQGLNGQFNWAQNSKSVQGVSEGFQIPQRIIDNPELMMLTKTNYGAMYLQMVLPYLTGQTFAIHGATKP